MISPPRWAEEELQVDRQRAIDLFRNERTAEPLHAYLTAYDDNRSLVTKFLDETQDLANLRAIGVRLLTDDDLAIVLRYLPGPPISLDDLKTVANATTLSQKRVTSDAAMVDRIVEIVLNGIDSRRFPWVQQSRRATGLERESAIVATAALMATRKTETSRRGKGKKEQEGKVQRYLTEAGLEQVSTRRIATLADVPKPGQFCRESLIGSAKADFVVGLWDRRTMAVECKVSNSGLNSIKRLNHDAAAKAAAWIKDFGTLTMVPTAVLGGVYNLGSLTDAQERNLTLFWAHDLGRMIDWINNTKE
ncbi:MAG: hypothetical protein QOH71_1724 [Blastocatellia bacterium]|jgi:hypothetical protein|nr:hypothetical protein [Blastocatellia bacterium]